MLKNLPISLRTEVKNRRVARWLNGLPRTAEIRERALIKDRQCCMEIPMSIALLTIDGLGIEEHRILFALLLPHYDFLINR